MIDERSLRIIKSFFLDRADMEPDFIFPGWAVDPAWRKENNAETPLLSNTAYQKDTPGVYAFFEPCNQNNEIEVVYIGRSKTLRLRWSMHWRSGTGGTEPLQKWYEYCWINDYPFCPFIAIFVSYDEDLRILENYLKHYLPARFNIH